MMTSDYSYDHRGKYQGQIYFKSVLWLIKQTLFRLRVFIFGIMIANYKDSFRYDLESKIKEKYS